MWYVFEADIWLMEELQTYILRYDALDRQPCQLVLPLLHMEIISWTINITVGFECVHPELEQEHCPYGQAVWYLMYATVALLYPSRHFWWRRKIIFHDKTRLFFPPSDTDRTGAADSNIACSGELKIICHVIFLSVQRMKTTSKGGGTSWD